MCLASFSDVVGFLAAVGTIAAATAGFCAVWAALKTHRESQATVRLVSRPYIDFVTEIGDSTFKLLLRNAGQGVGILKGPITASLDGQTYPLTDGQEINKLLSAIAALAKVEVSAVRYTSTVDLPVQAHGDCELLVALFPNKASEQQRQIIMDRVRFSAFYESLLGERWEARS
jgi:hypothetical protein